MKIKLGMQTITWGDPQDGIVGSILDTARACGYDGVEMGWRRIVPIGVEPLGRMLEDRGLCLVAPHAGGNLMDTEQAENERRQVDDILDGVIALGGKYLMYSGLKYSNDQQLAEDIKMLNATARRCSERGVQFLYHNHNYEFTDGARAFGALMADTVPELGFCPDVGWIHKGGQDCIEVLESIRDRVVAVHFKAFRTGEAGVYDFCCLEDGCAPFRAVADWVKGLDRDEIWVITEQDKHDGPPEDAVKRNAEFMRKCLG